MVRVNFTHFVAVAGLTCLAACEEGAFPPVASQSASAVAGTPAPATLVEQDVEAPDVFAANEAALWDGRPSLGGIWVAHPEVADPERVRITNEANGTVVVGALFRRERENPGPRLQVSSDAADALGMLAGQPSVLNVVALRREEVVVLGAVPETDEVEEAVEGEDEIIIEESLDAPAEDDGPIEETTLDDPIAAAEAAILAASNAALAGTAAEPAEATISREEPQATEPEAAVTTEVAAAAPVSNAAMAPLASLAPERLPDPLPEPTNVELTAATAIAEVEAEPAIEQAPIAAAIETPAEKLDKPFIQIGIFNVPENAEGTASRLRSAGVIPLVRAQDSSGTPFWRVVVGPATTEDEQTALMSKVRGLGFEDAYLVTN